MLRLCEACRCLQMANMLEGGRTPLLPAEQLQDMGFKIVAYPLSLLGSYVQGMQQTLKLLKAGGPESFPPSTLPSFQTLQAAVRFPEYLEGAEKYAALEQELAGAFSPPLPGPDAPESAGHDSSASSRVSGEDQQAASSASMASPQSPAGSEATSWVSRPSPAAQAEDDSSFQAAEAAAAAQSNAVEPDAILTESQPPSEGEAAQGSSASSSIPLRTPDLRWQDPAFRRCAAGQIQLPCQGPKTATPYQCCKDKKVVAEGISP